MRTVIKTNVIWLLILLLITTTATFAWSLELTKSFADDPVLPGGMVTLKFTISNTDDIPATGICFTDDLDAVLLGLVAVGLPLNDVCGAGSQLSGTSFLTLTGGNLQPTSSCTLFVMLQVPAGASPGTYPNTTSDLFQEGSPVGSPATAQLTVEPPPAFSKAFSPDTIPCGGLSTLTFTIDNTASSLAVTDLAFTDTLPAGVVVATPSNTSDTCTCGTLTAVAGSGTITYSGGVVAAEASCEIQVDVTSNVSDFHTNTTNDLTSSAGNSGPATASLTVGDKPAAIPALSGWGMLVLFMLTIATGFVVIRRRRA